MGQMLIGLWCLIADGREMGDRRRAAVLASVYEGVRDVCRVLLTVEEPLVISSAGPSISTSQSLKSSKREIEQP